MNRVRQAFTFLEVMLAVSLLGLVMTAVYATWSAGLNGWKRTVGVSENFQRERVVMGTLADLTQSIIFAPSGDDLYAITGEHNERTGDAISFVTASQSLLPAQEVVAAGMRRVRLALERDDQGHTFLGIANWAALSTADESPTMHVLSAEICGFAVRYRDPRDGEWKDAWDDVKVVPLAIEYTVGFGANDSRTPPVVVTRTVELPIAPYALMNVGQGASKGASTNAVTRRDIKLTTTRPVGGRKR